MKTIDLLGFSIPVIITTQKELNDLAEAEETDVLGYYDEYSMRIYISEELTPYWRTYYMFHEATHHVLYVTGIEQTMNASQVECICQSVATMCMQLLPQVKTDLKKLKLH